MTQTQYTHTVEWNKKKFQMLKLMQNELCRWKEGEKRHSLLSGQKQAISSEEKKSAKCSAMPWIFRYFFFLLSRAGEIFIRSENCKSRIITLMRVRVRTRTWTSLSPSASSSSSPLFFFCFLMLNIWRMCVTISLESENNSRSWTRLYNQKICVWGGQGE